MIICWRQVWKIWRMSPNFILQHRRVKRGTCGRALSCNIIESGLFTIEGYFISNFTFTSNCAHLLLFVAVLNMPGHVDRVIYIHVVWELLRELSWTFPILIHNPFYVTKPKLSSRKLGKHRCTVRSLQVCGPKTWLISFAAAAAFCPFLIINM